jgi:hypothetical protein
MQSSKAYIDISQALRLSKSVSNDGVGGKIVNLLSNDISRFDIALTLLQDLWKGPLEALLLGYFIYREIGVAGIIGIAFLLSFIPLQGKIISSKWDNTNISSLFCSFQPGWEKWRPPIA